jgi:hypothetical protein
VRPKDYIISLTMAVFFSICALIFVSQLTEPGKCSTEEAIFRRKEQTYLANHVIKTKQAETELECGMHCVADGSCGSVNYKTSGIGKGLCELNSKTQQEASDADGSMHNPEFNHLYIVKKVRKIRALLGSIHNCCSYKRFLACYNSVRC